MDLNYPDFTHTAYRRLIERLQQSGWQILRICDALTTPFQSHTLILRHDIDLAPALALPMAKIESAAGIRSTYFIALHLQYNLHLPLNANVIRSIAAMGHEVGLHYDSSLYPGEEESAEKNLALLDRHIDILQEICGSQVLSIARHNPSIARNNDPFQTCLKYNNAYSEQLFKDTVYISDSCGAWRNNGLKPCWHDPQPRRVYLLMHPEQWGETTDASRMARFKLMRARVMEEHNTFFDEVRSVWRQHAGGKEHDKRLRS